MKACLPQMCMGLVILPSGQNKGLSRGLKRPKNLVQEVSQGLASRFILFKSQMETLFGFKILFMKYLQTSWLIFMIRKLFGNRGPLAWLFYPPATTRGQKGLKKAQNILRNVSQKLVSWFTWLKNQMQKAKIVSRIRVHFHNSKDLRSALVWFYPWATTTNPKRSQILHEMYHMARETMIKSYYSTLSDWCFFHVLFT